MPAYCIWDVREVTDKATFEDYRARVGATVEKFDGVYLAAGKPFEVIEGDWRPVFPVIIQFPSLERAKAWYGSQEYRDLKAQRLASARCDAVFMDGLR